MSHFPGRKGRQVFLAFPFIYCYAVLLAACPLVVPHTPVNASPSVRDEASAVWGQVDMMSVNRQCNRPGSMTLCGPTQVAPDRKGDLWVTDLVHNRVLMFPPGSAIAAKVLGQYGSMTSRGCDQSPPRGSAYPPAPNRYTLCQPAGLTVDGAGTLYVADSLNNRILVYFDAAHKPADAPADRVLGQRDFHATASNAVPRWGRGAYTCPAPGPASPCSLNSPMELSFTVHGDLLVPDLDNHRVLLWPAASLARLRSRSCVPSCALPAGRVWGQYGSFLTAASNNPIIPPGAPARCTPITVSSPASPCTLSQPWSALVDPQGTLLVADTANNRVLAYDHALTTGRQDATEVYGQEGSFVTNGRNVGGVSASSLWHPLGLALDPQHNVWVTDFYNMRVLEFPQLGSGAPGMAIGVLGQQNRFSTNTCSLGARGLCGPTGVSFDGAGHAYVADGFSNRVLEFFSPPVPLVRVTNFNVRRNGSKVILRWRTEGSIRGFTLYAGGHRLTGRPIYPAHAGWYRYQVQYRSRQPYVLGVLLATGRQVTVQAPSYRAARDRTARTSPIQHGSMPAGSHGHALN